MNPLPLDGVLVVSCEQAVAAPLATRHLADLGARVIKIERPGRGDFARDYDTTVAGLSSHFVWLNRSKESVALDLKDPDAIAALRRISPAPTCSCRTSRPARRSASGWAPTELRAAFPRLVTCSVSGLRVGRPLPRREGLRPAHPVRGGPRRRSPAPTEHPAKAGIPAADIGAGMYAFSGILAALYERERTGEGTRGRGQPVRRAHRVDGLPAELRDGQRARPAADRHQPRRDRPLRRVRRRRRRPRSCSRSRTSGSGAASAPTSSATPTWPTTSASPPARHASSTGPALHAAIDAVFSGADRRRRRRRAWSGAASRTAGAARSTRSSTTPSTPPATGGARSARPAGPVRAFVPPIILPGRAPRMDPVPEVGEHTDAVLAEFP